MFRLTIATLFRLTALAAIGLTVLTQWPRSLPPARDGSITWYRGFWGKLSYSHVTGIDRFGCTYRVELRGLPGYARMTGTYPDGAQREETEVYVTSQTDGCDIRRMNVTNGRYFAPDGKLIAQVINGTGNVKYCRSDGSPAREYILEKGQLVRERMWYKNANLRSDCSYQHGLLHGLYEDYYPSGEISSRSIVEKNLWISTTWYDQNGNIAERPEPIDTRGMY